LYGWHILGKCGILLENIEKTMPVFPSAGGIFHGKYVGKI
jgi:hypothetical protein